MPQYRIAGDSHLNRHLPYPAVKGARAARRQHALVHDPDGARNGIVGRIDPFCALQVRIASTMEQCA